MPKRKTKPALEQVEPRIMNAAHYALTLDTINNLYANHRVMEVFEDDLQVIIRGKHVRVYISHPLEVGRFIIQDFKLTDLVTEAVERNDETSLSIKPFERCIKILRRAKKKGGTQ